MVKRNTRTADFTEDTRVPWWKERIPEVKEVDGGIYKDLMEAAAKAAADTFQFPVSGLFLLFTLHLSCGRVAPFPYR